MGAIIVAGITYSPTHIGVFATIGLLIAGQLVMGALIDAFGIFGVEKIPWTPCGSPAWRCSRAARCSS